MTLEKQTEEKTCFVIMGFGKKMDFRNTKEIDLDVIYKRVIQKVLKEKFPDYILIRADEIAGSQIIDRSMYALIMKADLVIADITTMNANAIYELGVRHALKPFSTIIMMQENERSLLPFDLNHNRILMYEIGDEDISEQETEKIRNHLEEYIKWTGVTDSPVYTVLPENERPENIDHEYQRIIQRFKEEKSGSSIRTMYKKAKKKMDANDFKGAIEDWKNLSERLPENTYVVQQLALAQYKSKCPDEEQALDYALRTLETICPDQSLDLETLGLCGAIYKRKYNRNQNAADLDQAIRYYEKGYVIKNDYYNGENYAFCLLEKSCRNCLPEEEVTALKYMAKSIFRTIVQSLKESIANASEEIDEWIYATLSTSCYGIGDLSGYEYYRELFYKEPKPEWKFRTYEEQLERLKKLLLA